MRNFLDYYLHEGRKSCEVIGVGQAKLAAPFIEEFMYWVPCEQNFSSFARIDEVLQGIQTLIVPNVECVVQFVPSIFLHHLSQHIASVRNTVF
jgi:hypothetical protein